MVQSRGSIPRLLGHYWVVAIWVIAIAACHPSRRTQPPVTTVPPTAAVTVPPVPATITPPAQTTASKTAAEAVQQGIAFLGRAAWEMEFVYLYTHLQPQFHWPDLPAQARTAHVRDSLRRKGDPPALTILHEMDLFGRLIDPQYRITAAQMATIQELDSMTVPALYCDAFPVDSARFFPLLRREAQRGGYQATHALLCYVWLQEKGCLSPVALARLRDHVVAPAQQLLLGGHGWTDLTLEGAALVKAAGQPSPADWVAGVVAAQRPDGGWSTYGTGDASTTHATILALWFLAQE